MVFFALVIALLIEQLRPLAPRNRAAAGLHRWVRAVGRNVDAGGWGHGWLAWLLAVVAPVLGAAGVHWLLLWLVGWPLALAWSVFVLYLTLGFRQFSHHFTTVREAIEAGDDERARQLLAAWKHLPLASVPAADVMRQSLEYSVLAAHRHVFGPLVSFALLAALGLGPAGAVLYRNAEFAARYWRTGTQRAEHPASPALSQVAEAAWRVIDWLPARATALGFAVVGSFEDAVDAWRSHAARVAPSNDGIVLAATAGAIGVRLAGAPVAAGGAAAQPGQTPRPPHFAQIVGLVWRLVALWLLLLALLTLARVMG